MMQTQEYSYESAESDKQKPFPPCPPSPVPSDFEIPEVECEDYYGKLPKSIVESLSDAKDAKVADAEVKKEEAFNAAKNKKQAAQDAKANAERAFQDGKLLLDKKAVNRKISIRSEYRKSLRETLPKNYCPGGDVDIENDNKVPPDQKAIKIAEFRKKLAMEDQWYLGELHKYQQNQLLAENNWHLAEAQFGTDWCTAKADETKAVREAELDWRTAIKKALDESAK